MKKKVRIISAIVALSIMGAIAFSINDRAEADAVKIRLGGSTRYETAVETSKNGWPSGSKTIVLVCGADYPDALSAAPLAKKYNAPILLTEKSGLSTVVSNEINRLNPSKAYIVGGENVISRNVESQLKTMGISIERLGGLNRYETATNVATQVGTTNGVVLASGKSFADSLSVAPVAANLGMPILLTDKDEFNSSNKAFIQNYNIPKTYVIGGSSVISDANMKNYKNTVRIGGLDRYETNIQVLNTFKENINLSKIYLASGMNFPDGLVGAPIAALTSSPIILIEETGNYYPKVLDRIKGIKSDQVLILGGNTVISDNIVNKVLEAVNYEEKFKVLSIE
ncbi:cell wall-binding repeat-containing protein [Clostridium sp.]|uniref:cell wall-binding repeat-containing protein n=1 Tax=Clostridium sp. TaxID=1506 RepID=UPI003217D4CC